MTKAKIIKYLEHNNISYELHENKYIWVPACFVYERNHSYSDWEGNPETDYGEIIDETLANLAREDEIFIIDCDDCCGCGDW